MSGIPTSLSADQAHALAELVREKRRTMGLSMRQLAVLCGLPISTLSGIESESALAPQPGTLKALATGLQVAVSDVYAAAGWLPAGELPSFRPYLRAKYKDLDEAAIADLERYAEQLGKRLGTTGPLDHEDELPN